MAKHTSNIAKTVAIGLIVLIGLSAGTASTEAAPVTFNFTASFPQNGVNVPVSGSYTFESTAADASSDEGTGWYHSPYGAPYGFTVNVWGQTFAAANTIGIDVVNGPPGGLDVYRVFFCTGTVLCEEIFNLEMTDLHGALFGSDAIPVDAPSFAPIDSTRFVMHYDGTKEVTGILTSLTCAAGCGASRDPDPAPVPEPGTLLLLTPGLALLARVRRRLGVIGVMALATGLAASSEAAPITYNFAGHITQTNFEPGNPYIGEINVDTPFSGSFTFDTVGAPPQAGSNVHRWSGLPYQMNAIVGGHGFSARHRVQMMIFDNFHAEDHIMAGACEDDECDGVSMEVWLRDDDHRVFGDTGVPLDVPALFNEFEFTNFSLRGPSIVYNSWWINGVVTSVTCANGTVSSGACDVDPVPATVPEPGTLLLLTPGLALLARVRRRLGIMGVMALAMGWAASSEAAPITYTFTGTVTEATFYTGDPFGGDITVGTTFSASYTFDTVGEPIRLGDLTVYLWSGPAYGGSVTIGGQTISVSPMAAMGIDNDVIDANSNVRDAFAAAACADEDCEGPSLRMFLLDNEATAFSDESVTINLPALLGEFEVKQFQLAHLIDHTFQYDIKGELTSMACANPGVGGACDVDPVPAPEPGTLLLLGPALAYLARVRRRINRAS